MKIIIQGAEVIHGTINDPVGQRCPGKGDTHLLPVLFLPVQRHGIRVLLVHDPCDCRGRCVAVRDQCLGYVCLHKLDIPGHGRQRRTSGAFCCFTVNIDNLALCRCEPEFLADEFLSDDLHFRTAVHTASLFVGKRDHFIPGRDTLKCFLICTSGITGMFFNDSLRGSLFFWQLCLLFGFIKQVQLPGNRFGFLTGCAEQFPGQVFHLLTQAGDRGITFLHGTAQGSGQLILAADYHIQLADRVLLLHDPGVICAFCHLSLPLSGYPYFTTKRIGMEAGIQDFGHFGGVPEIHAAAYTEGILPVFSGIRKVLGCSISRPDMSQSNCCQVRVFTSSEFLGHRKRPWASIRL